MSGNLPPYVLVHGAYMGAWAWGPVARILRSRGHQVFTPTQTGLGERRHLMSRTIDIETFVFDTSWRDSRRELDVLFGRARQMRAFTSTLSALAFVADGRLDGTVGRDMSLWDWVGGALLAEESGAVVGRSGPYVYAAGRGCAAELAACLAPEPAA